MKDLLLQLGLTPNEATLYQALSHFKYATVSQLSRNTKIHRTTIYEFLRKLEQKDLISHVLIDNVQSYSLNSPHKLQAFVDEKRDIANEVAQAIKDQKPLDFNNPIVEIHTGKKGIAFMLSDIIRVKKNYVCFGVQENIWEEKFSIETRRHMLKEKKANITWKAIVSDKELFTYSSGHYRSIPEQYFAQSPTITYGNNTAQIIWSPLTIIIIRNKEFAMAQKKHFELLWSIAKGKK
jgi:sugar-specific transcriptional regulator TrmB